MNIRYAQLKKAKPENVLRLARWLHVRNLDTMSNRQLCRFLHWLFGRAEKRRQGRIY